MKIFNFTHSMLAALGLSMGLISIAQAHHGFAFEFDPEEQGTVSGVVTNVRFANPHVVYMIDVETVGEETEEWLLLTHNVGVMRHQGWDKQTVVVGDRIEASGSLGRGGTNKLSLDSIILADGNRLTPRGGEYSDAYTTDEVNADAESFYGITTNGYPIDITGTWNNRYKFMLTVDDLEPKPTPFTEAGRKVFEAAENWDDPAKSCKNSGLPRWFGGPRTQEILDAGSHYVMINPIGTRRVWMNEREAPEHLLASPMGFSLGRWEDNALVIETTHLLAAWLDGSGLPMSGEGTRLVETYTVSDDQLTMDRQMTIHDPYYLEPLVRSRGSAREDGIELAEGGSGCDPTSYLRDLWQQGRIETLWNN